jgi:hypothetical protein
VPRPRWPAGVPKGVVPPARGSTNSWPEPSRWATLSINADDPVEVHLDNVLRQSAVEQVASSFALQYEHAWRGFVNWCQSLQVPRSFLPVSEETVALYLANLAEKATSFSVIKSASAAIAYHQKINLFEHNPTISPLATFVRAAFARRLGTTPKKRKAPFLWVDVVKFATAYLSGTPAYCHLVVVTCCVLSFSMCRFGELVATRPVDLSFSSNDGSVTIEFPKRKNDRYRHGSRATIVASGSDVICLVRLVRRLLVASVPSGVPLLFQGFEDRLVRRAASETRPTGVMLKFSQYRRYLSIWFGPLLGLSPEEFLEKYGSHSREGSAVPLRQLTPASRWRGGASTARGVRLRPNGRTWNCRKKIS